MNAIKKTYLPALDLLRAISIIAVVFAHTNSSFSLHIQNYGFFGSYGVILFFSISGFILSFLSTKEIQKNGFLNKKNFYIRRALRIWPNYFFALTLTQLFLFTDNVDIKHWLTQLGLAIVFLGNALNSLYPYIKGIEHGTDYYNVYWSLAVEEQFYLIFPFAMAFIVNRKSNKAIIVSTIAVCVVATFIRALLLKTGAKISSGPWPGILFQTTTYIDIIFISMVFGYWRAKKENDIIKYKNIKTIIAFSLMTIAMVKYADPSSYKIKLAFGFLIIGLTTGITVYFSSFIVNIKEIAPVRLALSIGRLSYGIYLFHIPIKMIIINLTGNSPYLFIETLVASYCFAKLIHHTFEIHFHKQREKIAFRQEADTGPMPQARQAS